MNSETDTREIRLLKTFAVLADTLIDEYEVVDLSQTLVDACQEFLEISDAGILLTDGQGQLEVLASTDERSQLIELMQLRPEDGPCVECYNTGRPIAVPDIDTVTDKWARFRNASRDQGFRSLHAFPMRLRDMKIGSLNLFGDTAGPLSETEQVTAQALADVATIGILQERSSKPDRDSITAQLERAFQSRAIIEQAKGVIAYQNRINPENAFRILRRHARDNQLTLLSIAQAVIDRTLTIRAPDTSDQ